MLLQQYLPFTVLKPTKELHALCDFLVATVLTVYGIETYTTVGVIAGVFGGCNSTYRLRY